ncbi:MAG: sigma-54-dependent Fis family transcriptional regulator [Sedimentisphaerales bacterium]|nr:sigma-54-dependent Fis family transcriptional regulator [Sedimentisphaerales bacterium]
MRILVVDDEEIKRVSLVDDLRDRGYTAVPIANAQEALKCLEKERFDVVVTDLRMPGIDGMELLNRIKRNPENKTEVILMTAYGSIPLAVEAMKLGAFDFITKPFRNEKIFPLLERIRKSVRLMSADSSRLVRGTQTPLEDIMVGSSKAMGEVRRMVELCARSDATVLLIGETGTGKDLAAHTIHTRSGRSSSSFVKVNCSTLPAHLIESGLFGHEKGAFTGADEQKKGKFDMAQGGTIYLDDVDDIPWDQQIKLVRVIEEKVFERVGGHTPIEADVKIIAATKKNLLVEAQKGTFRSDLYYRLNVLRITLAPLRERVGDLMLLVEHLLKRIAGDRAYRLEDDAMEFLQSHSWPGNVRELAHALERAFIVGNGVITAELLSRDIHTCPIQPTENNGFKDTVLKAERELLEKALHHCNGNKSAAARALSMKLSTFRDKLNKHRLS